MVLGSLVIRWCSPSAASSDVAIAPVAMAEPATLRPNVRTCGGTSSTITTTTPPVTWQRLVQRIEQDPRMRPNGQPGQGRDPFGPSAAELAAAKRNTATTQQKKIKRAPPAELLPADAGLVLNSTLVGSGPPNGHDRWGALLGGRHRTGLAWERCFRLIEIYPRQVVLERQGKHYGLEIKSTNPVRPFCAAGRRFYQVTSRMHRWMSAREARPRNQAIRLQNSTLTSNHLIRTAFSLSNDTLGGFSRLLVVPYRHGRRYGQFPANHATEPFRRERRRR